MTHGGERDGRSDTFVQAGDCIAGRYHLVRRLGRGSFGEVWAAHDEITRRLVAVKLLFASVELAPAEARVEIGALRQRLPGVVEMTDDGVHEDRAFVVMELVDGSPFPGREAPCSWDDLKGVTVALLETLVRVHGAFLIHRDLKPENVLVTQDRQVRLLDFGIAYRATESIDIEGALPTHLDGTCAYMAPEQVRSKALDERTDLYALGVMLYEALAGRPPHDETDAKRLLFMKVNRDPTPLRAVAPHVPNEVARVVDRMLARKPAARPRTAFDVLSELREERSVEDPLLPWIGPQTTLFAVLAEAREGRSVDIVGPPGSGRTHHLFAARQSLSKSRSVALVGAGSKPFESLGAAFGDIKQVVSNTGEDVLNTVVRGLREKLVQGLVILADVAAGVDAASAEALSRARGAGVVIRALDEPGGDGTLAVRLGVLDMDALRNLFVGPDRLLHLREDGARRLFDVTQGVPAAVVRELSTWVDLGIARWVRNLVAVPRDGLLRLSLSPATRAPRPVELDALGRLTAEERDVLVAVTYAWPHAEAPRLAGLLGAGAEHVDEVARRLVALGLLRTEQGSGLVPVVPLPAKVWPEERVRAARARLALSLPRGERGRLAHLVAAGAATEEQRAAIAEEAAFGAQALIDKGYLAEAISTIETGLRIIRASEHDVAPHIELLLGLWAEAAFEEGAPQALDRVLYALGRARPRTPLIARLEHMMRGIASEDVRGRALAILRDVEPFSNVRLERVRIAAFAAAARKLEDASMEVRLDAEVARSPHRDDPELLARVDHLRGRARYLRGKFSEAADLHDSAARKSTSVLVRMAAMSAGAYALAEVDDFDRAKAFAEEARKLAAEHRHAAHEVVAEWALRTIAYRSETATEPDAELVAAAPYATGRQFQGLVLATEAAIAWRAGQDKEARSFAREGQKVLSEIKAHRGDLLLRCFLVALGEEASDEEVARLREEARASDVPGIGIQALALLALGGVRSDGIEDAEVERLAALVPRQNWGSRGDILSVDEALSALRSGASPRNRLANNAG